MDRATDGEMQQEATEDLTVRLEPNLHSFLANVDFSPVEGLSQSLVSERSRLRDRLRDTENELRRSENERAKLTRDKEWLVTQIETKNSSSRTADHDNSFQTGHGHEDVTNARQERDDAIERLSECELRLADARREAAEAKSALRIEALEAERRLEAAVLKERQKHSSTHSKPRPPPADTEELTQKLARQTAALRAELEAERAKCRQLERELRTEKSFKRSTAVAEERVRCLNKLLEEKVVDQEEMAALRLEKARMEQQIKEWSTLASTPAEARKLAASATSMIRSLEDQLKCARADVDKERRLKTKANAESASARIEAQNCRHAAKVSAEAQATAEQQAWLKSKENDALRQVIQTYDNPQENQAGLLKAHLEAFNAVLSEHTAPIAAAATASEVDHIKAEDHASAEDVDNRNDDEDDVRIVHMIDNPLARARRSWAQQQPQSDIDEGKLNARLKERFREHLNWFREAVYLLTGFKIDMTTTDQGPHVRLRSMFAEDPLDALLFHWTDDGVQLLATPFANKLDERLFASLTLCNSVPAFLANVQLDLFEKQTLMPAASKPGGGAHT